MTYYDAGVTKSMVSDRVLWAGEIAVLWSYNALARYDYDAVGNRTAAVEGGTEISYVNNNYLNQYDEVGTPGGEDDYSYDLNGNLTGIDIDDDQVDDYVYTYDLENRLIKAEEDGTIVAKYYYDYAGRRIAKVADSVTTTYCYDGDQVIAEYKDGTLKRKFIYGPGIDEPVIGKKVSDPFNLLFRTS
jgi:YD repeat-containing protein